MTTTRRLRALAEGASALPSAGTNETAIDMLARHGAREVALERFSWEATPEVVLALLDVVEAAEHLDEAWTAMRHVDPTEEGVGARVTALRAALRRLDAAGGSPTPRTGAGGRGAGG